MWCMRHGVGCAGNATKEHEELGYMSHDGTATVSFHWLPRFADHEPFETPPLGAVDDRTGRLRFNQTLHDVLEAIETHAGGRQSLIVLGSQIFDILKAPLSDYQTNLRLLVAALQNVGSPVCVHMYLCAFFWHTTPLVCPCFCSHLVLAHHRTWSWHTTALCLGTPLHLALPVVSNHP